jgi:UDP-N-acetylmuramate--alanine ligase
VLGRTRAVHCVGVGGSGMSAIAELLLRLGYRVSGSDTAPGEATDRLSGLGLAFHAGHSAQAVDAADVVVVSAAIRADNPELVEARRRGIPVVPRGDMLAALMRPHFGIAVAGAHGKTTTASMVAVMLERAGLDPTAVIGGRVPAFGSNARAGQGDLFVAEADESDRSFLRLQPSIAVITNIDDEHMEAYGTFDDLEQAFATFANLVPFYGTAVLCLDDPHVRQLRSRVTAPVVTYGLDAADADVGVDAVSLTATGSRSTVIRRQARTATALGPLTLCVPGRHNVQNALAAVAVGLELGLEFGRIAPGLEAFHGAARRFEVKGERAGVVVVDDYGHHPTEIAAVIDAARAVHPGRIVVVFQPHRYSRTARLQDAFGPALARADAIVLTDIYPAGEDPLPGVTLERFTTAIEAAAPGRVHVARSLADVPAVVARLARAGDLVITVGAGSIGACGPRILEELAQWG